MKGLRKISFVTVTYYLHRMKHLIHWFGRCDISSYVGCQACHFAKLWSIQGDEWQTFTSHNLKLVAKLKGNNFFHKMYLFKYRFSRDYPVNRYFPQNLKMFLFCVDIPSQLQTKNDTRISASFTSNRNSNSFYLKSHPTIRSRFFSILLFSLLPFSIANLRCGKQ